MRYTMEMDSLLCRSRLNNRNTDNQSHLVIVLSKDAQKMSLVERNGLTIFFDTELASECV